MSKRFLLILAVCVLGFIGIFMVTSKKDSPSINSDSKTGSSQVLSSNTIGKNTKNVTLLEYGDFQCPACAAYHPLIKEVIKKYENEISFQFRNFPLQDIHQNARAASRAAEAAGKQNKYWDMHDLLYEQQKSWETSNSAKTIFEGYAKQLGLNLDTFKKDFASSEVNAIINADFDEGQKQGVNSTPTFFLQGKKLEKAPQDLEGFSKIIDKAIKEAEAKKQQ
jgi:protein-disulfide isomerase